jgi:hypothetical protein
MLGNMMVNKALTQSHHKSFDFHSSRAGKAISAVGNCVMRV